MLKKNKRTSVQELHRSLFFNLLLLLQVSCELVCYYSNWLPIIANTDAGVKLHHRGEAPAVISCFLWAEKPKT